MIITSLVLGIVAIFFSIIPLLGSVAYFPAIISIIFGAICILKKQKEGEEKQKKGMAIAGIILSIIAIFIVNSMNSAIFDSVNDAFSPDTDITISNSSTSPQNSSESTSTETTCSVGQTIQNKDLKITFLSLDDNFAGYSKYADVKSGYKIIKATFEFENISNTDQLASSYDFNCYADGYDCESFYSVDDSDFSSSLSSGKKSIGSVYFQVPANANSINLEYETNMWTGSKLEFIVK